jgi:hypothetical protein
MGIVENIKDAADLAKKVGDIELYRKIVHLEGEVMELTREKRQAEQKIEEFEKQLALKAVMKFERPFYFQEGDATPFCPRCFEKDTTAIHLFLSINRDDLKKWECRECNSGYRIEDPNYDSGHHVRGSSEPGPWG